MMNILRAGLGHEVAFADFDLESIGIGTGFAMSTQNFQENETVAQDMGPIESEKIREWLDQFLADTGVRWWAPVIKNLKPTGDFKQSRKLLAGEAIKAFETSGDEDSFWADQIRQLTRTARDQFDCLPGEIELPKNLAKGGAFEDPRLVAQGQLVLGPAYSRWRYRSSVLQDKLAVIRRNQEDWLRGLGEILKQSYLVRYLNDDLAKRPELLDEHSKCLKRLGELQNAKPNGNWGRTLREKARALPLFDNPDLLAAINSIVSNRLGMALANLLEKNYGKVVDVRKQRKPSSLEHRVRKEVHDRWFDPESGFSISLEEFANHLQHPQIDALIAVAARRGASEKQLSEAARYANFGWADNVELSRQWLSLLKRTAPYLSGMNYAWALLNELDRAVIAADDRTATQGEKTSASGIVENGDISDPPSEDDDGEEVGYPLGSYESPPDFSDPEEAQEEDNTNQIYDARVLRVLEGCSEAQFNAAQVELMEIDPGLFCLWILIHRRIPWARTPTEDKFDERVVIYAVCSEILQLASHPNLSQEMLEEALDDGCRLLATKFPDFTHSLEHPEYANRVEIFQVTLSELVFLLRQRRSRFPIIDFRINIRNGSPAITQAGRTALIGLQRQLARISRDQVFCLEPILMDAIPDFFPPDELGN